MQSSWLNAVPVGHMILSPAVPIEIDPRLQNGIQIEQTISVQVVSRQVDQVRAAMYLARRDIAWLDAGWQSAPGLSGQDTNGPQFVSAVEFLPDGAAMWIDPGFSPLELLVQIPGLIKHRLEEAGVTDALVSAPAEQPHLQASLVSRIAVLRLYPRPGPSGQPEIPAGWIPAAAAWLRAGLGPRDRILAGVSPVQFQIGQDGIDECLEMWWRRNVQSNFMVTFAPASKNAAKPPRDDIRTQGTYEWRARLGRVRGVGCSFLFDHSLELVTGGTGANDEELAAGLEALKIVARQLAPETAYSYATLQPNWRPGPYPDPSWDQRRTSMVLDAFPYQVLGPGHVERLEGRPKGSTRLRRDRIELELGLPVAWRFGFRSTARQQLRTALLGIFEGHPRVEARYGPDKPPSRRSQPLPMGLSLTSKGTGAPPESRQGSTSLDRRDSR
jgi:hypothetical protein